MVISIHPQAQIGTVCLNVSHLDETADFYVNNLGFELIQQEAGTIHLGVGEKILLILKEKLGAKQYPGRTGLYHFAILVPSRRALARSLRHLSETKTPLQGFADHWVSEAIYLADPEGNGIEIYRDRSRDQWPLQDGRIQMSTEPLDIEGILGEIAGESTSWTGLEPGTQIGHIHLQVSDISSADQFYTGVIGFDLIMHFGPSAGFVSAGGYHHHVGYNTWSSRGAGKPPDDAGGLAWYTIDLPSDEALERLKLQVTSSGHKVDIIDGRLTLEDPSANRIILRVRTR